MIKFSFVRDLLDNECSQQVGDLTLKYLLSSKGWRVLTLRDRAYSMEESLCQNSILEKTTEQKLSLVLQHNFSLLKFNNSWDLKPSKLSSSRKVDRYILKAIALSSFSTTEKLKSHRVWYYLLNANEQIWTNTINAFLWINKINSFLVAGIFGLLTYA